MCVCLCLRPSHFLSTRLQVRPLNGILQLKLVLFIVFLLPYRIYGEIKLCDSLEDADLCKDVAFRGLDDE